MAEPHEHLAEEQDTKALRTEEWRSILTGENGTLLSLRRWWRLVPSSPRCKICAAPFHGPGKLATSILMHGQSRVNPLLCGLCFRSLAKQPGGAEVRAVDIAGRDCKLDVVVSTFPRVTAGTA
jgi:hypothetical protein